MADEILNETALELNETAKNGTEKIPATPEGMAVAYGSLVIMALLPIFFGAFRSVKYHKEQKVGCNCQPAVNSCLGLAGGFESRSIIKFKC